MEIYHTLPLPGIREPCQIAQIINISLDSFSHSLQTRLPESITPIHTPNFFFENSRYYKIQPRILFLVLGDISVVIKWYRNGGNENRFSFGYSCHLEHLTPEHKYRRSRHSEIL